MRRIIEFKKGTPVNSCQWIRSDGIYMLHNCHTYCTSLSPEPWLVTIANHKLCLNSKTLERLLKEEYKKKSSCIIA